MSDAAADTVYHNGQILTVDRRFTICQAMAKRAERIVATGSDAAMLAIALQQARRVDLRGRTLMPGLIDAHAHMDREGLKDRYPTLAGATSIDDILAKIATLAQRSRPGEWIVTMPIGEPPSYWDVPHNLKENRWPTRCELDESAPDNPVYIRPIWGLWRHKLPLVSIANSRALQVCGIGPDAPAPCASVVIERDAAGRPNGIFTEWTFMSVVEMTLMRGAGGFSHEDHVDGDTLDVRNQLGREFLDPVRHVLPAEGDMPGFVPQDQPHQFLRHRIGAGLVALLEHFRRHRLADADVRDDERLEGNVRIQQFVAYAAVRGRPRQRCRRLRHVAAELFGEQVGSHAAARFFERLHRPEQFRIDFAIGLHDEAQQHRRAFRGACVLRPGAAAPVEARGIELFLRIFRRIELVPWNRRGRIPGQLVRQVREVPDIRQYRMEIHREALFLKVEYGLHGLVVAHDASWLNGGIATEGPSRKTLARMPIAAGLRFVLFFFQLPLISLQRLAEADLVTGLLTLADGHRASHRYPGDLVSWRAEFGIALLEFFRHQNQSGTRSMGTRSGGEFHIAPIAQRAHPLRQPSGHRLAEILRFAPAPFGVGPARAFQRRPDALLEVPREPLCKQRVRAFPVESHAVAARRFVVHADYGVGEHGDAGREKLEPARAAFGGMTRRPVRMKIVGPVKVAFRARAGHLGLLDAELAHQRLGLHERPLGFVFVAATVHGERHELLRLLDGLIFIHASGRPCPRADESAPQLFPPRVRRSVCADRLYIR
ncbi:MAG: hypothetical protein EXR27_09950 [Betaproteobacteria bacterium]|nr:hypothetical protein [Betaproteobacteria bacterium]